MKNTNIFNKIVIFTILLAWIVIILGSYTRLTHAGLGCPDWPKCYGHLFLPHNYFPQAIQNIKAWTEMLHRYVAGSLVILIFGIAIYARNKLLPLILVCLVIFQALLGMWTVTMQLLPIVVIVHLFGGILIFTLLCCFWSQINNYSGTYLGKWRYFIVIALVLLSCQIILGGLVSANYAGIACLGFPKCNGVWLPYLNLNVFHKMTYKINLNYQGGILDNISRITLHYMHRIGAVIICIYLTILSCLILKFMKIPNKRYLALIIIILVTLQFILGILNVLYLLPIQIAVAHTGIAALLLAALSMLLC